MESLTFLTGLERARILPLYVVHGEEEFLKRLVLKALRQKVLGAEEAEFGLTAFAGDRIDLAAVLDELQTVSFFGSRRLVLVEGADTFVSKYRPNLEKLVQEPPTTGVLILEVKTWPAATRLAKLLDTKAAIQCKAPASAKLPAWCIEWTKSQYDRQLTQQAAQLLVDLIGAEMGQLDQELQKLVAYIGKRNQITEGDVDKLVGRSQGENTWKIFDAIGAGNVKDALEILDRLLEQGEEPLRILGAFSMQLRRLAQAARLAQQGVSLATALEQAGVPPYFSKGCQQQLKHLGAARANQLYDWLLGINLDLRGGSPLPARTLLERLVIRLARPAVDRTTR